MTLRTDIPVILLALANDADSPLRWLAKEHDALQEILKPARKEGKCEVVALTAATPDKLMQTFQEYRGRIRVMHYAGHSNQDALLLGKDYPGQDPTQAVHLAEFLALQEGLELLFLNSCLSLGQAAIYYQAGLSAVLATSQSINDEAAVIFARLFYQGLAGGGTISKAFREAKNGMNARYGGQLRGIFTANKKLDDQVPWKIFPATEHTWRLPLVAKRLTKIPSLNLDKEFLGREQDLDRLARKMETSNKVVLMNGLGGIGKTVLATAYTQIHQPNYDHIAWINRGEDLINSFALNGDLAETLGMPIEKDDPPEERFPRILHKLRNLPGNNLLVIDNARQQVAQKDIYELLPGHPNWRVLLTSRLDLPQFDPIRLDTLGKKAARQLFQKHFQGNYTETELDELLEEIGFHTLTIELLARLLTRVNNLMSVAELTAVLREKQLHDPDLQEVVYTRHSGEERGIYLHLMKAFELTDLNEEETWLLKQFVVLPVEQYPVAKLAELLGKKPLGLNKILNRLATKGWLTRHQEGSFSIHRLVWQAIGYKLKLKYGDVKDTVDLLAEKLGLDSYGNIRVSSFLWSKYAEALDAHFFTSSTPSYGNLLNNLGLVLLTLGYFEKAENALKRAKAISKKQFETNSQEAAVVCSNLGNLYREKGDYKQARVLLQRAKEIYENILGIHHPFISRVYSNLGTTLQALGEFGEAKKLFENAVKLDEYFLGSNSPSTATRYMNFGTVLMDLGDYKGAREELEKAKKVIEVHYGQHHTLTAVSYSNLGSALQNLKKYKRARSLLEQANTIMEEHFGKDHHRVAQSYSNLGTLYHDIKNYDKAMFFLKKAKDIDEKHLGGNHVATAIRYSNLGYLYYDIEKYMEAKQLVEKALQVFVDNLVGGHPHIKTAYSRLMSIKNKLGGNSS